MENNTHHHIDYIHVTKQARQSSPGWELGYLLELRLGIWILCNVALHFCTSFVKFLRRLPLINQ